MCGCFVMRWSCVFLLSSCCVRGGRLLSLLLGFAYIPLPAAPVVFRGMSCRRLPFGGYATFLAPYACPAPAVELCLWGLRCLYCGACFCHVTCSSYGACGFAQLPLPPVTLRGFCIFSAYVCLPDCCTGGVGWAAALPLHSQCFCADWLADDSCVLHPVTGFSH